MPRSQHRRPALAHPEPDEFDVLDILHALSDPTRMTIVQTLRTAPERACGTFPVDVAPSTLTHHFRVLRLRRMGGACFSLPAGRRPDVRAALGWTSRRLIPHNRHGMLLELVVENYAVVERLRVHFHPGLNLLTGETGSGKSIVVDALGLLLGGRASAEMIRTGEARARVAGIFEVPDQAAVRRLLEPAGLEVEEGELLIEREILTSGKS